MLSAAVQRLAATSSWECGGLEETVCLVTTDSLGQGDRELGKELLANFFRLLAEGESVPVSIFLMNAGVYLAVSGSRVLDSLNALQARGTEVLSCQTCINSYALQQEVRVGLVVGMADFLELAAQYKVLTIC